MQLSHECSGSIEAGVLGCCWDGVGHGLEWLVVVGFGGVNVSLENFTNDRGLAGHSLLRYSVKIAVKLGGDLECDIGLLGHVFSKKQ